MLIISEDLIGEGCNRSFSLMNLIIKRLDLNLPLTLCKMPIELKLSNNILHGSDRGRHCFYFTSHLANVATTSWICVNRQTEFGIPTKVGLPPS